MEHKFSPWAKFLISYFFLLILFLVLDKIFGESTASGIGNEVFITGFSIVIALSDD